MYSACAACKGSIIDPVAIDGMGVSGRVKGGTGSDGNIED